MNIPIVPPKGVIYGETYKSMSKVLEEHITLVLWQRFMPNFVNGWIEHLRWAKVAETSLIVNSENLKTFEITLTELVNSWGRRSPDMSDWVIEDILALTSQFIYCTGAENISLKITPNHSRNPVPESYERRLKLVTSYGCSGFFWSKSKLIFEEAFDLQALDVLLVKGFNWPGVENNSYFMGSNETRSGEKSILLEIEYLD